MQYALDHPDLVQNIFTLGTPYMGSTSASVDHYLLNDMFSNNSLGEKDIVDPTNYLNYMERWNSNYEKLYSNINVYAVGGYSSIDMLLYALLRYAFPNIPNTEIVKLMLNSMNRLTALISLLPTWYAVIPAEVSRRLAGEVLDILTVKLEGKVTDERLLGVRAVLELLLCEIELNGKTLAYDLKNDGLVDLASQLGYCRETGEGYKGFNNYIRRFSIFEDIDNAGASDAPMPRAVHNLEARDQKIIAYIMENITCS